MRPSGGWCEKPCSGVSCDEHRRLVLPARPLAPTRRAARGGRLRYRVRRDGLAFSWLVEDPQMIRTWRDVLATMLVLALVVVLLLGVWA